MRFPVYHIRDYVRSRSVFNQKGAMIQFTIWNDNSGRWVQNALGVEEACAQGPREETGDEGNLSKGCGS